MTGVSGPARRAAQVAARVIALSIASGFDCVGYGGSPSTAVNNVAPSAQASEANDGSPPRASSGEK